MKRVSMPVGHIWIVDPETNTTLMVSSLELAEKRLLLASSQEPCIMQLGYFTVISRLELVKSPRLLERISTFFTELSSEIKKGGLEEPPHPG